MQNTTSDTCISTNDSDFFDDPSPAVCTMYMGWFLLLKTTKKKKLKKKTKLQNGMK